MIVLDVIIAAQTLLLLYVVKSGAEERRRLLNAVVAQSPADFAAIERAAATKPKKLKKRHTSSAPHPIGL